MLTVPVASILAERFGRNLPVSIKATLRHHIAKRSLEQDVVAEGAEQAVGRRSQGIAAARHIVRPGPPGQPRRDERIVLAGRGDEEQAIVRGRRAEGQRELRREPLDQRVGGGGAEEDDIGAVEIRRGDGGVGFDGRRKLSARGSWTIAPRFRRRGGARQRPRRWPRRWCRRRRSGGRTTASTMGPSRPGRLPAEHGSPGLPGRRRS